MITGQSGRLELGAVGAPEIECESAVRRGEEVRGLPGPSRQSCGPGAPRVPLRSSTGPAEGQMTARARVRTQAGPDHLPQQGRVMPATVERHDAWAKPQRPLPAASAPATRTSGQSALRPTTPRPGVGRPQGIGFAQLAGLLGPQDRAAVDLLHPGAVVPGRRQRPVRPTAFGVLSGGDVEAEIGTGGGCPAVLPTSGRRARAVGATRPGCGR